MATRWLGLCVVMAGCEAASLDAAPWDPAELRVQPPTYGGCGDMVVYGSNTADTLAVVLSASGVAEAAHQAGHAIWRVTELPHAQVSLRAQQGTDLTSAWCSGVQPWPGPVVAREWTATEGKLWVRITPDPGGSPSLPIATADVHFRDVRFTDPVTGGSFAFPPTTMNGITIGLYPP